MNHLKFPFGFVLLFSILLTFIPSLNSPFNAPSIMENFFLNLILVSTIFAVAVAVDFLYWEAARVLFQPSKAAKFEESAAWRLTSKKKLHLVTFWIVNIGIATMFAFLLIFALSHSDLGLAGAFVILGILVVPGKVIRLQHIDEPKFLLQSLFQMEWSYGSESGLYWGSVIFEICIVVEFIFLMMGKI